MGNNNLINIALDWQKQEQRREMGRLYNQITDLCKEKDIKWEGDLSTEIKIGRHSFPCNENGFKRARDFVLNLEQKELGM